MQFALQYSWYSCGLRLTTCMQHMYPYDRTCIYDAFFYVQQADPVSNFFVFEAQGTRAVRRFKSLAEVAWSQSLKDLEWFNQNEVACMLHMYSTYYMMHNWNIIQRCETRMSLFRPKFAVRRYMKFLFAGSSGQVSSVAEVKLPKTEVRVWAGKLHA